MARDQRIHADIGADRAGVDVDDPGRNQLSSLALPQDTDKNPADREIDPGFTHQPPVVNDPAQKARQHQTQGKFGVEAGAIIVRTIKIGHPGAKPLRIEKLIDPHQHMVIADRIPRRPADEKLWPTTFLPTQHRSLSASNKQAESDIWIFFNSRQGIIFLPGSPINRQHRIRIRQRFQRIVAEDVTQGIGIPLSATQYRLLPPGCLVAGSLCPHPPGLAPFLARKATEKLPGRRRNTLLREQRPHPRLHIPKRRSPKFQRFLDRQSRHP
ncbi:hypothetical protein IT41_03685 [Paracoccus halophilus]|uniref:Uncharacterized protein n=1 Tax=Paracoccus halophilus TaxID=376733 RepID=A0A099F6Z6_9RHOB|nr:hypothetical protein IT41_03685 [Paracoccus halophilus]